MNWQKSAALAAMLLAGTTLASCDDVEERAKKPENPDCEDLEYDNEEGVWYCDDDTHRGYYYGNTYYSSKSAMKQSSAFKKGTHSVKPSPKSSGKTGGFGRGSGSSGG